VTGGWKYGTPQGVSFIKSRRKESVMCMMEITGTCTVCTCWWWWWCLLCNKHSLYIYILSDIIMPRSNQSCHDIIDHGIASTAKSTAHAFIHVYNQINSQTVSLFIACLLTGICMCCAVLTVDIYIK
jgi:hypothetical protein